MQRVRRLVQLEDVGPSGNQEGDLGAVVGHEQRGPAGLQDVADRLECAVAGVVRQEQQAAGCLGAGWQGGEIAGRSAAVIDTAAALPVHRTQEGEIAFGQERARRLTQR